VGKPMNAITPTAAPVPANDTGSLLNFVAMAVRDSSIDVAKLDALLRMQREIIADERKLAFYSAMSAAQSEMRPVLRDKANTTTNSRYATFEALDRIIRPIYTKHGFLVMCDSEPILNGVRIWCEVAHSQGHSKIINAEAPLDLAGFKGTANKTPIHGWKSAISYLRRATLELAFNLATTGEDDDGNAAGNRQQRGDTGELISGPQVAELRTLLAACSANPAAVNDNEAHFLDKMGLRDLRSLADVRPDQFTKLRITLIDKRKRMDAAKQTGNQELAA
jgi:hypothetical protein